MRPRWVKEVRGEDGVVREQPAETPRWHPSFEEHARDCIAQGVWTDSIRAWFNEQPEEVQRELVPNVPATKINVPIRNIG